MKLEAVTTCVNYSDFLEHTLPDNIQHFDRFVVVTHPDDKKTQRLCNKYGADVLTTKLFHDEGDTFNKGKAINLGLSHLKHSGWLLHLDADILLPHKFKQMLVHSRLNPKYIYGADRLNTHSYDHWQKHKHKSMPQHQWRCMVTPNDEFTLGSRLLHQEHGYCPIGCFQLWHSTKQVKYPVVCGSAEHSDVLFAVQWPREERILIPEFFVYHLESEGDAEMGINWHGRKTKPFGPCKSHHKKPKEYCK